MSKTTKKKYVAQEVLHELVIPEPPDQIAKVTGSRGNNLHDVMIPDGTKFLASMPTKFRRSVWVKRGDYVVLTPIEEGDKVKAEISRVLYREQIRYIRENKKWPSEFDEPANDDWRSKDEESDSESADSDASSSDGGSEFVINNPNRGRIPLGRASSSSSSESEEESENAADHGKEEENVDVKQE